MASDQRIPPLTYIDDEIVSFIPAGWSLVAGSARWDGDENAFRFTLLDGSDLDWEVSVPLKAVTASTRVGALRAAVDDLERKRFKSFL
jgi:hypothetical protein